MTVSELDHTGVTHSALSSRHTASLAGGAGGAPGEVRPGQGLLAPAGSPAVTGSPFSVIWTPRSFIRQTPDDLSLQRVSSFVFSVNVNRTFLRLGPSTGRCAVGGGRGAQRFGLVGLLGGGEGRGRSLRLTRAARERGPRPGGRVALARPQGRRAATRRRGRWTLTADGRPAATSSPLPSVSHSAEGGRHAVARLRAAWSRVPRPSTAPS